MEAKKNIVKPSRSVLGRGLSALISSPVPVKQTTETIASNPNQVDNKISTSNDININPLNSVTYAKIELVINNPSQPRQEFKEAELQELCASIKALGVLQPILVRKSRTELGKLEIVAGERRWRAAKLANLTQVPVIIKDISDLETLEVALVENIQRANLNPIEEAQTYQRLMEQFGLGQQEVAERVGKDRASVSNYLRILKLPNVIIDLIKEGKLTIGHAKALLTIKEPAAQISLAKKVVDENLSVRGLEAITSRVVVLDSSKSKSILAKKSGAGSEGVSHFPEVVDRMRTALGTKVSIKHHESGRGRIEIEYFSEQELDRVVEAICK